MFEARLAQGVLLRKLLDSMKDLVQVGTTGLSVHGIHFAKEPGTA